MSYIQMEKAGEHKRCINRLKFLTLLEMEILRISLPFLDIISVLSLPDICNMAAL